MVSFKRDVYRRVMKEFASVTMSLAESAPKPQNAPAYRRKEVKPRIMLTRLREIVEKVASAPRLNEALDILVTDVCRAMETEVCSVYWLTMTDAAIT